MSKSQPATKVIMSFKAIILTLPLLSFQIICLAQETEKNGLPCVAEICLGDGITELSKLEWDRAKNPFSSPKKPLYTAIRKLSEAERKILRTQFRGNIEQAAPFLYDKQFDSIALPALSLVSAACMPNELIGTYTTKNGNPTRVGIALTPNQTDTSKQKWTVITIMRSFPAAVSTEQKAEVETQLVERYRAFGAKNMNIKNAKLGEGRFFFNYGAGFGFHLSLFRGIEEENRMKLHPTCGGTAKIKID